MFKIDVDNINGKTESLYVYGEASIWANLKPTMYWSIIAVDRGIVVAAF
jgi:hypothetical protein